jgi:hypothetical protein
MNSSSELIIEPGIDFGDRDAARFKSFARVASKKEAGAVALRRRARFISQCATAIAF